MTYQTHTHRRKPILVRYLNGVEACRNRCKTANPISEPMDIRMSGSLVDHKREPTAKHWNRMKPSGGIVIEATEHRLPGEESEGNLWTTLLNSMCISSSCSHQKGADHGAEIFENGPILVPGDPP